MQPKRKKALYVILGIVFLIFISFLLFKGDQLIGSFLYNSNALPVRAVHIDGVLTQVTKKQIADITGKVCGERNIATCPVNELKNEIMKEPWIAQVAVAKQMRDTIKVAIVEHVPFAIWNDNGLYDAKTKSIFYPDMSSLHRNFVKLGAYSDDLCTEVYETAIAFVRKLDNSPYQLVELRLDNVRSYTITLENGVRLIIGRDKDQGIKRLDRFIRAFPKADVDINDVDYIDLRYDVGFAIGRK